MRRIRTSDQDERARASSQARALIVSRRLCAWPRACVAVVGSNRRCVFFCLVICAEKCLGESSLGWSFASHVPAAFAHCLCHRAPKATLVGPRCVWPSSLLLLAWPATIAALRREVDRAGPDDSCRLLLDSRSSLSRDRAGCDRLSVRRSLSAAAPPRSCSSVVAVCSFRDRSPAGERRSIHLVRPWLEQQALAEQRAARTRFDCRDGDVEWRGNTGKGDSTKREGSAAIEAANLVIAEGGPHADLLPRNRLKEEANPRVNNAQEQREHDDLDSHQPRYQRSIRLPGNSVVRSHR